VVKEIHRLMSRRALCAEKWRLIRTNDASSPAAW
jgi:hypothetical protein